jgi:hypothetical protein
MADEVRSGDRVRRQDGVRGTVVQQPHAPAHGVRPPADPAVRPRKPGGIVASNGEMTRSIEREGPLDDGAGRNVIHGGRIDLGIRAGDAAQDDGFPAEARQMLREPQCTLNAAAPRQWREMVRNDEYPPHLRDNALVARRQPAAPARRRYGSGRSSAVQPSRT